MENEKEEEKSADIENKCSEGTDIWYYHYVKIILK